MSDNQSEARQDYRSDNDGGQQSGGGSLFGRILLWILGIIVLLIVGGACLFFYYASSAPKISRNELASQSTTTIYDRDNRVISRLGAQKREYARDSQIPDSLKQAVVSIEDRRFYKHHGVDPVRIIGAAANNVVGRSNGMQGGSTLTQQLVKLSVFSTAASDRTFKRKAQEAWLAINVERHFSKQQILDFYINKVYMGNGVYGMKTAAQYYYGKNLNQLNLAQLAELAGIPQSPTYYNPLSKNTQYATQRRNEVLNAMVRSKYISSEQANSAKQQSVTSGLDPSHGNTSSSDANVNEKVVDAYVKQVMGQLYAKGYNPYNDGLQVHTNLDLGAQQHLYNAANNGSVNFQSDKEQVGVAVTDPHNGQIVAMLGGRKTGKTIFGLNRAVQTDRSSGSTAKPLMDYGPAIDYLQWPTYKSVQDTRFVYPGTNVVLHDFDHQYKGTMTMRAALVQSRNVPAIRTLQTVGISRATEFLKGLGISQKKAYTLQNGIGLYISPLQMAASYAAFANGGIYYRPYYINSITTQDGQTIKYSPHGHRAMSRATAYMLTWMMKGVMTSSQGSGTAAKISGVHQAGKTGTTEYPDSGHSGVMDSWFAGYTKNYSIAVWTGYDQPMQPNSGISDSHTTDAQLLYKSLMEYLDDADHASDWSMPSSVEAVRYRGHRELVIRDSKWAFGMMEDTGNDNDDSSSSSHSNSSSSSSNGNSSRASSSSRQETTNNGGGASSSSSAASSSGTTANSGSSTNASSSAGSN